jgi:hypothetical protein
MVGATAFEFSVVERMRSERRGWSGEGKVRCRLKLQPFKKSATRSVLGVPAKTLM